MVRANRYPRCKRPIIASSNISVRVLNLVGKHRRSRLGITSVLNVEKMTLVLEVAIHSS
jgi:hypothetical protein